MALKGGSFITGKTDYKNVFIPEEFTEEQIAVRDMVKDFCIKEIHGLGLEKVATMDAEKDRDLVIAQLEKSAELGLCGVAIGEEHGGIDLDFNTGLLFGEAIALSFSFATTIGAHTSIGSLPIVYYGNQAQKDKYLPGVAAATIKAAYALTEPSAGSDANSGKTKATLNAEKTHYILNGQKMWITNGGFADIFIVFAKIDDDKDLSAFIVERNFGGVTTGKEEKKLGIKASSTVQVFFNNTPVPVENLLGERGEGFKMALNILNSGRIKLAAGSIGGAKFAVGKSIEYANQRFQFNQPISNFGAMKYKFGELITKTFAIESAVYRTGRLIDLKTEELVKNGVDKSRAKLEALKEYAVECAILKVYGSETLAQGVDEAIQVHGGMGYSVETGIEMGYRDARITRIYEGTNEINRMLSVAELGKRAAKKELDIIGATKGAFVTVLKNAIPFSSPSQEQIVENLKAAYLLISAAAYGKLKMKLVDEQEIVINLADILAEAYVAESLLLRIQKLRETSKDKEALEVQEKLLNLYLYEASAKVRKIGTEAIASFEGAGYVKTALNLLTKEYNVNPKELRRAVADYGIKKNWYPFIGISI